MQKHIYQLLLDKFVQMNICWRTLSRFITLIRGKLAMDEYLSNAARKIVCIGLILASNKQTMLLQPHGYLGVCQKPQGNPKPMISRFFPFCFPYMK